MTAAFEATHEVFQMTELERTGFFREMPHGAPSDPSLAASQSPAAAADEDPQAHIVAFGPRRLLDRAVAHVDRLGYPAFGDCVGRIGAGAPGGRNQPFGKGREGGLVQQGIHRRLRGLGCLPRAGKVAPEMGSARFWIKIMVPHLLRTRGF